jgi:hypothetical protein
MMTIPNHRTALSSGILSDNITLSFANFMLNDLIYLMDESLIKANQASEIENLKIDSDVWHSMPRPVRLQYSENLRAARRGLRTMSMLCSSNLGLIWILLHLASFRQLFLREELIGRLAQSCNFYINALSAKEFNLKNAIKLRFEPIRWLCMFLDIVMMLQESPSFLELIVDRDRLFELNSFQKSLALIRPRGALINDFIECQDIDGHEAFSCVWTEVKCLEFGKVIARLNTRFQELKEEELDLGEIPTEFLGKSV